MEQYRLVNPTTRRPQGSGVARAQVTITLHTEGDPEQMSTTEVLEKADLALSGSGTAPTEVMALIRAIADAMGRQASLVGDPIITVDLKTRQWTVSVLALIEGMTHEGTCTRSKGADESM
ncbi:MAG TPA: hypothetical protein VMR98_04710, partial [Candidatus Polarisedimenticolaceae bacterium]|nr:hypothetical protein [Candidatus Polarisedimenticolaceae bacterium]